MEPRIIQTKKVEDLKKDTQKKKMQTVLLVILLLVFIFLMYKTFFTGTAQANKKKPTGPTPPRKPIEKVVGLKLPTMGSAAGQKAGDSKEDDWWGGSPFALKDDGKKDEQESVQATQLHLSGIIFDHSQDAYALVNEKIVKKGDVIADNTVKDIYSNSVVLEDKEGKTTTLQN